MPDGSARTRCRPVGAPPKQRSITASLSAKAQPKVTQLYAATIAETGIELYLFKTALESREAPPQRLVDRGRR